MMSTIFVTVGSTRFDSLIEKVLDSLIQIERLGFNQLIIQAGRSQFDDKKLRRRSSSKLSIEIYQFKPSLLDDIKKADVVIGHAGAGTCLEVLRLNKRLIVVVNESLMDNHQRELADQLSGDNYLLQTTVGRLNQSLDVIWDLKFNKFPRKENSKFEEIFDECLIKCSR